MYSSAEARAGLSQVTQSSLFARIVDVFKLTSFVFFLQACMFDVITALTCFKAFN